VDVPEAPSAQADRGLARETFRFVVVPRNAVSKHRELHRRLAAAARWVEGLACNQIRGSGPRGVVAAGFVHHKLLDVMGEGLAADVSLLKLGSLYPIPEEFAARFLTACREVLVLEENEPYVEEHLHALAHRHALNVKILGKQTGHVAREGELYRWQIQQALGRFLPQFQPARDYRAEDEAAERPPRENYCAGCRFGAIVDALEQVAAELGEELYLVGDPGCLATIAERLDAKYALGSAVGVADGLSKAGISARPVALFGDSSFFHTMLPAICAAVANRSDILMVVLDNGSSVTTGLQPHPGAGRDALGRPAPALSIERIAQACGVPCVRSAGPDDLDASLPNVFREALAQRTLTLLVVRTRCEPPQPTD
jgi:indolepyruvate ferredoxin oxidoreductase alpha subunit